MVVVVGVVSALICLLILQYRPSTKMASYINCKVKLLQIGMAFSDFSKEHNNHLPMLISTNQGGSLEYSATPDYTYQHFKAISRQLGPTHYLICPQDTRRAATNWENLANTNVSYFIGLDSERDNPMAIIAGDRNITPNPSVVLQISKPTSLDWIKSVGLHGDKGHLIFSDGHVEELDSTGLANAFQRTGIATNHFAVP